LSRIEAGREEQLRPAPVDLAEIARSVLRARGDAAAPGVTTGLEAAADAPPVLADADRIRQVVENLVGNALKFTERGEVVLSARRRAEPPGVTIEITDTGIGIPADKLEQIFQPFTQVDPSRTREYEGTGLGLAICRRLLEMMSGTITARSRVGEGSAFTIELPTAIAAPAVLTTPTRAAS
ncbi:MAG: hypothetical protein KC468_10440, partial [Myxococcales bacterium]|nr:hypothetical protein [Myxococcales bacterium]